jgi:hypothetical protein
MSDKVLTSCDKVTRVEIIDSTGRIFLTGSYKTTVHLQDMGLTLKIFINERPYHELFAKEA